MSDAAMRIIHTSDWHLGRRFERESLDDTQRAFLEWLTGQIVEHQVHLVIVAGDIYDRSLPAEDAVTLLDEALDAMSGAGAELLLIPGNHDSARRLGFGARRQALSGVHVFADDQKPPAPWVFEAGGEQIAVVAVPFLEPLTTPPLIPAPDGSPRPRTHQNVLSDALDAGREALRKLPPMPSIAVAHAYVIGATPSDSEKALGVGGAEAVSSDTFAGFDYVALGHLHRPQTIGGNDRMAYSGSPLPYSFSEEQQKSIRLLVVAEGTIVEVNQIPIPIGRPVVTLEGTLADLLANPEYETYTTYWVAARLTDETVQVQPMERLRERFPHAVSVRYTNSWAAGTMSGSADSQLVEVRSTGDVVLSFLAELYGREAESWERDLVNEAVSIAHQEREQ
ncbi:MAG: exonuclease SbcCD subunit D C-terminal domain-containing protein [Actinobacteria bacterium]|jgi:exonuclease SbcD|nr:exonuclease SbcCD subunit D C-terminal domain-containing protein [Actinomycetota bacterium]